MTTTPLSGPLFRPHGQYKWDPFNDRGWHRVSTLRNIACDSPPPMSELLPFYLGRLTHYYEVGDAYPKRRLSFELAHDSLTGERVGALSGRASRAMVHLFEAPTKRLVWVLSIDAKLGHEELIDLLEDSYYLSFDYMSEGRKVPLLQHIEDCLGQHLGGSFPCMSSDLHQMVFLSADHAGLREGPDRVRLDRERMLQLVYREADSMRTDFTSVEFPGELNRSTLTTSAVGSYVSVFCGHQDYLENACLLSAVTVLGALCHMRTSYEAVNNAVTRLQDAAQLRERERRAQLTELYALLTGVELVISGSVESVFDIGMRIPSLRVEAFHAALVRALRIPERSEVLSNAVARLKSVAQSEAQYLEANEQIATVHRRRTWSVAAGLLSTVAAPLGLLLMYFSVSASEIDPKRSMFDLQHYGIVYVVFAASLLSSLLIVLSFFWYDHPRRRRARAHLSFLSSPSPNKTGLLRK